MTDLTPADGTAARHCRAALNEPGSKFCEACGKPVSEPARERLSRLAGSTSDARRRQPDQRRHGQARARPREPRAPAARRRACSAAAQVDDDGYCTQCGTKAPSPRDHFEERPAPWVAGVCDRGIRHTRNEDAMALAVEAERVVLVVCDGVSNSVDSDVASLAAAKAVLDVLRPPLPKGLGVPESAVRPRSQGVHRRRGRRQPGRASTRCRTTYPTRRRARLSPPCSRAASVHYCGLGDSRVYLLPDAGDGPDPHRRRLDGPGADRGRYAARRGRGVQAGPLDHQVARQGQPRRQAPGRQRRGDRAGLAAGLLRRAVELRLRARRAPRPDRAPPGPTDPHAIATHLVAFANASGGQDNITVALARVGDPPPWLRKAR